MRGISVAGRYWKYRVPVEGGEDAVVCQHTSLCDGFSEACEWVLAMGPDKGLLALWNWERPLRYVEQLRYIQVPVDEGTGGPRYNVAPGTDIGAFRAGEDAMVALRPMH